MDKFPLLLEGRPAGELTAEEEPLYTWLTARCPLPEGLWCAWVIGEQGTLRLGVLEPQGAWGSIRRRFSHRLTAPLGRILRGEVRPGGAQSEEPPRPDANSAPASESNAASRTERWTPASAPERLFRTPWLRQRLQGRQGALASFDGPAASNPHAAGRQPGWGFRLALPWDPKQPFPLPPLFCFARLEVIGKSRYLVFSFDGREQPVF